MSKGKHGNKEAKKPKKPAAPPADLATTPAGPPSVAPARGRKR